MYTGINAQQMFNSLARGVALYPVCTTACLAFSLLGHGIVCCHHRESNGFNPCSHCLLGMYVVCSFNDNTVKALHERHVTMVTIPSG